MSRTKVHAPSLCTEESTADACDRDPFERLRFWNGRFLVARDLSHQQADLIRRLQYHQRFAHGWGVLCGFEVKDHPREDCRPRWIVVGSGQAYDCHGRTLWMPEDLAVELPLPAERREPWEGFLVARRVDRLSDPMPALFSDNLCDPIRQDYGRMREDVEIVVLPPDEVSEKCWPRHDPVTYDDCSRSFDDDCDVPLGYAPPCDCECACGTGVVLARLRLEPGDARPDVDTSRRPLISGASGLTSIDGINWPHGGTLSADRILNDMDRTLVVRFSRPLRPTQGWATGINPMTFTVSYLNQTGAIEQILPPDPEDLEPGEKLTPLLSPNRRCAVFRIPRRLLAGRTSIEGSLLMVKLRCDFLPDCHGRCVSAAHLWGDANGRGTGDRSEGGIFESWFHVEHA